MGQEGFVRLPCNADRDGQRHCFLVAGSPLVTPAHGLPWLGVTPASGCGGRTRPMLPDHGSLGCYPRTVACVAITAYMDGWDQGYDKGYGEGQKEGEHSFRQRCRKLWGGTHNPPLNSTKGFSRADGGGASPPTRAGARVTPVNRRGDGGSAAPQCAPRCCGRLYFRTGRYRPFGGGRARQRIDPAGGR